MPVVCLRPASSNLAVMADSIAPRNRQADRKSISNKGGISLRLSVPAHGVPAIVAYAHHDNYRNVPDKWCMKLSRFAPLSHKRKTGETEIKFLLTCFLTKTPKVKWLFQNFFQILYCLVNGKLYSHFGTAIYIRNFLIGHALVKIQ